MRVLFAIGSMRSGGAERVMSLLTAGLLERGHEVTLLTLASADHDFYALPAGVRRIALCLEGSSKGAIAGLRANLSRIHALRRQFAHVRPDVVLSFLTSMNVLCALGSIGMSHRLVVSERIDPSRYSEGRLWTLLRTTTYRRASCLVVQTEPVAAWFRRELGVRSLPIAVIPNPVVVMPSEAVVAEVTVPVPVPYVLAIGRLERQKGFDVLLRAFAKGGAAAIHAQLWIAGAGSELASLVALAESLGIGSRVRFLGQVKDVAQLLRGASLFVLSSRFEGMPNALLEALAAGVPVVSTDCPTGPRELLSDAESGLLVPVDDVDSMAEAISRVLLDPVLAARMRVAGRASVGRFALENVTLLWESVLGAGARP